MAQFVLAEIVMFFNFFSYFHMKNQSFYFLNTYFKGNRKSFPLDFFFFFSIDFVLH